MAQESGRLQARQVGMFAWRGRQLAECDALYMGHHAMRVPNRQRPGQQGGQAVKPLLR